MLRLLKLVLRRLLAGAAIAVIVIAVAIGALRLLMTQIPQYQSEIKAWVGDTVGLSLGFAHMDVRLGLRGPELTFYDAAVAAEGDDTPFLVARRAAVVVDPWAALTERELRVASLTFEGTRLTLERGPDDILRVQGAPAGPSRVDLALVLPAEVEIGVRDSDVVYVDRQRGVEWAFENLSGNLTQGDESLQIEAAATPPAALGSRIEIAALGDLGGDAPEGREWRVFGDLRDVDFAALSAAVPAAAAFPERGRGDVSLWLDWAGGAFDRAMLEANLDDVAFRPQGGAAAAGYEHLAFAAEWQRLPGGWQLALNDVDVTRDGRTWPDAAESVLEVTRGAGGELGVTLTTDFLRLEDLAPIVAAVPPSSATLKWLELAPRGDLVAVDLDATRADDAWDYTVSGTFDRLGVEPWSRWPGFDGLSGELRADTGSGRVSFATRDAAVDWPQVFRAALDVDELSGLVVWREGFDATRVVSDDLVLENGDGATRSNLELTLPHDGGSPVLDIETGIGPFQVVAAKRYFPVHKMPAVVVEWLDEAIRGGAVTSGKLSFVGPLAAFPFDHGEGVFRVALEIEDGVLAFVKDWPRAEELTGTVEFVNASFAARGAGRVLGNVSRNIDVGIEDLRDAVLTVRGDTHGPLGDVLRFLKESPLIARHLGPGYARLNAPAGTGDVALDLSLPLKHMRDYELEADLAIADGELAIDGFPPRVTEVAGALRLADGAVTGEGIEAIFLDGPVTARVSAPGLTGYRARLDVEGEVTADAAASTFELPLADLVAGQTRWQGSLMIPAQTEAGDAAAPLKVSVASNLSGVALKVPPPFAKAPADPTNLKVDFVFDRGALDVEGHVGAAHGFALRYAAGRDGLELDRGSLRFGGGVPELGSAPGLTVDGSVPALDFDEWLALARGGGEAGETTALADTGLRDLFTAADLDIAAFSVFGQQLGTSRLNVRRDDGAWRIDIDSAPVAGTITVPKDVRNRAAIVADMQRLYLVPRGGSGVGRLDPRRLPGLSLTAAEFAFGARRFDGLRADVRADPVGLRVVSFESRSDSFTITGSGGWFEGPEGPATRLAFNLSANDVAAALAQLALDPIASGEMADITASVYWPGPPSADWTQHLGGDVALRLETGSLLDIDPGAGRVVGLMSISALPRRLALDFRDVFNKGLVFDEIAGDFAIIDGNAFTDNLKVTGPVAEIGVAGRIGLRDRDYRQQAVVTAEPGKMLPTVGGLIGGPGVGAALLIFTRIFKEPLKGIGRASYCVTGTWEEPVVERLSAERLEQGELCAELPSQDVSMLQP